MESDDGNILFLIVMWARLKRLKLFSSRNIIRLDEPSRLAHFALINDALSKRKRKTEGELSFQKARAWMVNETSS